MADVSGSSVWDLLREYADTQTGTFTSQEAISWFRRHAPARAADSTIRVLTRGASANVDNRAQFANREPFLMRVGHGTFRSATPDEIAEWRSRRGAEPPATRPLREKPIHTEADWYTEENTQRLLVEWLRAGGWTIVRTANTATREHGVDVVAELDGKRLGVEVKGYPSRVYAAGPRKGQAKPTAPANQAPKWFSHALVPAMKVRTREPETRSVICFPDFPVYRRLWTETGSSLAAAGIEVWIVAADGAVSILQ